jgi:hypothetical protein
MHKKESFRTKLYAILAALFVVQAFWSSKLVFPAWSKNYSPVQTGKDFISGSLSADQMLFALAGFRELIAGILWVRADSFFDTGNYDAILPIIGLVTFLDPHQIDVYATGMWHVGYNFTDEEQRSDRRYLPAAVSLGAQGATQNSNTYELFFETAWMWHHKIDDDYPKAVKWMKEAYQRTDILPARKNLLCRIYERNGQVEESLNNWYSLLDNAQKLVDSDKKNEVFQFRTNRDTITNNVDTLLIRMTQRGFNAKKDGRSLETYDINPPFNVGFSAKVSVVGEKVLRVQGTWNVLPVGTRIRCVLRDKDYPNAILGSVDWDKDANVNFEPPKNQTYMQEQLFVRNQRFDKKIDMSRDPTMYPFVSKDYVIEFYYNPRSAPAHIQDKFGWNGEGMTDNGGMLNTVARPGQRVIYYSMPITKDQILQRDTKTVFKTPNYVETDKEYNKEQSGADIPSLRSGK